MIYRLFVFIFSYFFKWTTVSQIRYCSKLFELKLDIIQQMGILIKFNQSRQVIPM